MKCVNHYSSLNHSSFWFPLLPIPPVGFSLLLLENCLPVVRIYCAYHHHLLFFQLTHLHFLLHFSGFRTHFILSNRATFPAFAHPLNLFWDGAHVGSEDKNAKWAVITSVHPFRRTHPASRFFSFLFISQSLLQFLRLAIVITEWHSTVGLFDLLLSLSPYPIIRINNIESIFQTVGTKRCSAPLILAESLIFFIFLPTSTSWFPGLATDKLGRRRYVVPSGSYQFLPEQ